MDPVDLEHWSRCVLQNTCCGLRLRGILSDARAHLQLFQKQRLQKETAVTQVQNLFDSVYKYTKEQRITTSLQAHNEK